ncbi:helix-turn-helix transcriptional regulator [Thermococcus sp.]
MRTHLLKASCENGKLILFLRIEVDLEHAYKVELTELERDVLEFILQNGEVTQKKLSKIFGKVKACRVIQNLEKKGLIERSKKGRTYVIRVV